METLIAFFSHKGETYYSEGISWRNKGNANVIADKLKEMTGADIFEIKTIKEYPSDYKKCCDVALQEQQENIFPPLKEYVKDMENYKKIILVYPNWWGTMPQAVFTFLSLYDFSNKIIYPICTHEGSKMGRSVDDIKKSCPLSRVNDGLAIQGSYVSCCDEKLNKYLKIIKK